jgi:hypothetical protein
MAPLLFVGEWLVYRERNRMSIPTIGYLNRPLPGSPGQVPLPAAGHCIGARVRVPLVPDSMTTAKQTDTPVKTDPPLSQQLNQVLADSYALMALTHLAHWNVSQRML